MGEALSVPVYRAALKLPASLDEKAMNGLASVLDETGIGQWCMFRDGPTAQHAWVVEVIVPETSPSGEALDGCRTLICEILGLEKIDGAWSVETMPDIDWLAHSYKSFPPFSVGPFFIYGSHYDGALPDEQISMLIDAATAFGSGEHPTTAGCLLAMADLKEQGFCPWNVLDLGTGSGILAIAAWKLWKTPVLATDIDPESVRVASRHRDANAVPSGLGGMACAAGDGLNGDDIQAKKPYELVIANIHAAPLREMTKDLVAVCDSGARVILSGLLHKQADEMLELYGALGLVREKRFEIGDWSTLVLRNPAA